MVPIYHCEMCSTPVYIKFGSGRFCSRSCSNKWVALNQSEEAKINKVKKGITNLVHKGLKYKYTRCQKCGKTFNSNKYKSCSDCRKEVHTQERKDFFYKKLLEYSQRNDFIIDSTIIKILEFYNLNFNDDEETKKSLCWLIIEKDLRQIADELNLSFTKVKKSFNKTGIPITIKRCSVDHLIIKEIIEDLLSDFTVTEKTLKIEENWYSIDEYYDKLKIAFEIDGKWCHDKEKDKMRDHLFQSVGIKTVRIPSNYRKQEIISLFKENGLFKIF